MAKAQSVTMEKAAPENRSAPWGTSRGKIRSVAEDSRTADRFVNRIPAFTNTVVDTVGATWR